MDRGSDDGQLVREEFGASAGKLGHAEPMESGVVQPVPLGVIFQLVVLRDDHGNRVGGELGEEVEVGPPPKLRLL